MPEGVQQVMARALHLLGEPANRCHHVVPHLSQEVKTKLFHHVVMIAGLELSGFALLPPPLQPRRKRAAKQYLNAARNLLGIRPCLHSRVHLAVTLELIKRLGESPPPTFTSPPGLYEKIMIINLKLFELANYNVLNVLNELLVAASPATGFAPQRSANRAIRVLKEIYNARRSQILRHFFTRFWLNSQQMKLGKQEFYDVQKVKDARAKSLQIIFQEFDLILQAVATAGGQPVSPFPIIAHDRTGYDPAGTASHGIASQLALETPEVDMGVQELPGSSSQQEPPDTMGDAGPAGSTLYQAHYLYGLSEGADDGYQQAGAGDAASYAGRTAEDEGLEQLPGASGPSQGHPAPFPQQEPYGPVMDVHPFASPVVHQPTAPSSQIPPGFMQVYPGEYPPQASGEYGLWGQTEEENVGDQEAGPDGGSFQLGATAKDGHTHPLLGTSGSQMGAQADPAFMSQQELHGVMPFGASVRQGASVPFSQAPPAFMPGFSEGSSHGTAPAGPQGSTVGTYGVQQPAGYGPMIYDVETADLLAAVQIMSAAGASAFPSEGGAVGGQPVQGEDPGESEDILGLIKTALDWNSAFEEESQTKPQPVLPQDERDAAAGVVLSASTAQQAPLSPIIRGPSGFMQGFPGKPPYVAAPGAPQASVVRDDAAVQKTSHGEGAYGLGAASFSYVAQTGSAETTSASASEGHAAGGQHAQADEDSEEVDDLLELIYATVGLSAASGDKDEK
ncbi:hypothetical protein ACSSS7_006736 [Eimeria intestinalis]